MNSILSWSEQDCVEDEVFLDFEPHSVLVLRVVALCLVLVELVAYLVMVFSETEEEVYLQ